MSRLRLLFKEWIFYLLIIFLWLSRIVGLWFVILLDESFDVYFLLIISWFLFYIALTMYLVWF